MDCVHCGKPVKLWPSATFRANKYGGSPKDYESMFPAHSQCTLDERARSTLELIARLPSRRDQFVIIPLGGTS